MNNIDKSSIKYLIILLCIYVVIGLILYPILDFIYYRLVTKSEFVYSVEADVIKPTIVCSIMALCSWIFERKTNNN